MPPRYEAQRSRNGGHSNVTIIPPTVKAARWCDNEEVRYCTLAERQMHFSVYSTKNKTPCAGEAAATSDPRADPLPYNRMDTLCHEFRTRRLHTKGISKAPPQQPSGCPREPY